MDTKRTGQTYDDITRRTVPNADGSFRPSREQVENAYKEPADRPAMVMAADEQALHDKVMAALHEEPTLAHSPVRVDVEGTRVILSGRVAGPPVVQQAEELVRGIDGVTEVENHLTPDLGGHAAP